MHCTALLQSWAEVVEVGRTDSSSAEMETEQMDSTPAETVRLQRRYLADPKRRWCMRF